MSTPKNRLKKAREDYSKNNDVQKFYNRIVRLGTNTEEGLFPVKVFEKNMSVFRTPEEYDESFSNMIKFQKQFTEKQKQSFDVVLYHGGNLDGTLSAYLYWEYITKGGTEEKKIEFIARRPDFRKGTQVAPLIQQILPQLKGKNILMVDLFYNRQTYEAISNEANFMVAIDDHHDDSLKDLPNHFSADKHATVGVVWKFFHPELPVPYFIQYVDSDDAKLFLAYLPEINAYVTAMYVRFVKNQKKWSYYQSNITEMFKEIHEVMSGPATQGVNFLIVLGRAMQQFRENMKMEIAHQASPAVFQGYKVYVLNFSLPGMTKLVAKHIASIHKDAAFAVVWHYNMQRRMFDVTLSSDHDTTKSKDQQVDLNELAKKLGKGGGHFHSARFTLPGSIGALDRLFGTGQSNRVKKPYSKKKSFTRIKLIE